MPSNADYIMGGFGALNSGITNAVGQQQQRELQTHQMGMQNRQMAIAEEQNKVGNTPLPDGVIDWVNAAMTGMKSGQFEPGQAAILAKGAMQGHPQAQAQLQPYISTGGTMKDAAQMGPPAYIQPGSPGQQMGGPPPMNPQPSTMGPPGSPPVGISGANPMLGAQPPSDVGSTSDVTTQGNRQTIGPEFSAPYAQPMPPLPKGITPNQLSSFSPIIREKMIADAQNNKGLQAATLRMEQMQQQLMIELARLGAGERHNGVMEDLGQKHVNIALTNAETSKTNAETAKANADQRKSNQELSQLQRLKAPERLEFANKLRGALAIAPDFSNGAPQGEGIPSQIGRGIASVVGGKVGSALNAGINATSDPKVQAFERRVADVVSLVGHDRYGGALTVTEVDMLNKALSLPLGTPARVRALQDFMSFLETRLESDRAAGPATYDKLAEPYKKANRGAELDQAFGIGE